MDRTGRTTHHREILGIDKNGLAMNLTVAGDHAICRKLLFIHTQAVAAMIGKKPQFNECVRIQQFLNPLTGCQLPFFMLGFDFD